MTASGVMSGVSSESSPPRTRKGSSVAAATRWIIEEFHRVEKEGCRLQATQLDDASDIGRLASITAIVAVRLLQLRDAASAGGRQT